MVVSNHLKPPELVIRSIAADMRSQTRMSPSFKIIYDEIERRFGDFEVLLKRLTYVSADSAYLLQPQKDGSYEPVVHNIHAGQLITALERGFLPLALEDYLSAIETKAKTRKNSGERGNEESQAGSTVTAPKTRKARPFKCEQCTASATTQRRLNNHIENKHGGS